MSYENRLKWFDKDCVFDFEKKCLVNYKTRKVVNVTVFHYLYGEDGSCFDYEEDFAKFLNPSHRKSKWLGLPLINLPDLNKYIYFDDGIKRGFGLAGLVFSFANDFRWCYMDDYFYTSEKWYDVDEDTSLDDKLTSLTWLDRG